MLTQTRSSEIFTRAQQVMPGGCSRNTVLRKPHPIYAIKGEGCYVTDVDGKRYIDFQNNVASLIHGHAHPEIVEAVNKQIAKGSAFAVATEREVEYAEELVQRCDSFEKLRFVNSGTEAVMACIKTARAYTGRPKIAKIEGSYHGLYDYAEVSQTAGPDSWGSADNPASVPVSRGTPQKVLDDVVVIPFNNTEAALSILDRHKDELAGVLIDLLPHRIGVIPAEEDFVLALRKWTHENDALLIADEVITFRTGFSGVQGRLGIVPDLTAMGKMVGGGFPVGCLAGRADVMDVMNPLERPAPFTLYGTFSANPVTMTAGRTAMRLFDQAAVDRLNGLADYARTQIAIAIKDSGTTACVTGQGSMFRIHFCEASPTNYREAYIDPYKKRCISDFLDHAFQAGILLVETCTGILSTPMTKSEIDRMAEIFLEGFRKLQKNTNRTQEKF